MTSTQVRSASERAARALSMRSALRGHRNVRARVALWPSDWREAFEERAAIVEFCGGLSRADAEALAAKLVEDELGRVARGPPALP